MTQNVVTSALLLVVIVVCAWAYPRLNGMVYRRRIARDEADLRAASPARDPAAPPDVS